MQKEDLAQTALTQSTPEDEPKKSMSPAAPTPSTTKDRVDKNDERSERSNKSAYKSKAPKSEILTRSKSKKMAGSSTFPSVAPSSHHSSTSWRSTSSRSNWSRSSTSSARARKAALEARIKSQKHIDELKQQQMQQRLRLEEKQLAQKRRAEDQRRHEEEREFQLMKEREHQDMIFQQQLEHAHLQAELDQVDAELSSELSNIGCADKRKCDINVLTFVANDNVPHDHPEQSKSTVVDMVGNNADAAINIPSTANASNKALTNLHDNRVKSDVIKSGLTRNARSGMLTDINKPMDLKPKFEVPLVKTVPDNESLILRPVVDVSSSVSVPVAVPCTSPKVNGDANVNCAKMVSNLNPYSKPFETKTLYVPKASNTNVLGSNGTGNTRVMSQFNCDASIHPGVYVPTQSAMQTPTLSDNANPINPANVLAHSDDSQHNSYFTKLPTLKVEPPFFNGNPADYFSFIKAFDVLIDQQLTDSNRKLFFLLHYTKDIAHSLIKGCQHMQTAERGYQEARGLLQSYFGQRHKVIEACIRPIVKGPALSENDHRSLIKFSADFTSCLITLQGMDCLNRMDNMDMVTKIMNRLPQPWIPAWNHEVDQILHKQHRDISINDLGDFVRQKTRESTNLSQIPTSSKSYSSQENSTSRKTKNFSTQVKNSKDTHAAKCLMCEKEHFLNQCKRFRDLNYHERIEFVSQRKLCRACLKEGHFAKFCRRKNEACKKRDCKQFHTTLLHPPDEDESNPASKPVKDGENESSKTPKQVVKNGLINLPQMEQSLLPVVPVKIRRKGSAELVITKALLDTGSTHSFVTEDLRKKLKIEDCEEVGIRTITLNKDQGHQKTKIVSNLEVTDMDEICCIPLSSLYSCKKLPVNHKDIPTQAHADQYAEFEDVYIPEVKCKVGLLIGNNNRMVMQPQEVIREPFGSYAIRTPVGWTLNCAGGRSDHVTSPFVRSSFDSQNHPMCSLCTDIMDSLVNGKEEMSVDQQRFMKAVNESTKQLEDHHYEIGLPIKYPNLKLQNNRVQALQRASHLRKKFSRNDGFYNDYKRFVSDMIDQGYCERVEKPGPEGRTWFLPHHGVYHPEKPGKIRVVFDCSAQFNGVSLNGNLLQGPDLTNSLLGVLMRFRRELVAVQADIKAMFHQVRIPVEDRDLLRFIWWKDGNIDEEIEEYRMTVYPFGTVSSPSCANFALKRAASDHKQEFDKRTVETVKRDFYVDDCLTSAPTVETAIKLVHELRDLLDKGGFCLNKWISSSREVMGSIPKSEWSKEALDLDLASDELPTERALGLQWNVEKDSLTFKVQRRDKPCTRRGILSMINSVFDPLGFGAVAVLPIKVLLQKLCRDKLGWDDPIPPNEKGKWLNWLEQLSKLKLFTLPRCFKPPKFGNIVHAQLHHFADASEGAYGSATYLRMINKNGEIHCSLIFGKGRLAPLKPLTIPRLELCAAVVASQNDLMIRRELQMPELEVQSVFWTDSVTVLCYLNNESKCFHTFVANRIQRIKNVCDPSQWHYVPSKDNPADLLTRGLTIDEFLKCNRWNIGPAFLWQPPNYWPTIPQNPTTPEFTSDPEVRRDQTLIYAVKVQPDISLLDGLCRNYSSWHKIKRVCAQVIRCKNIWLGRSHLNVKDLLSLEEIQEAEYLIFRHLQRRYYGKEIEKLQRGEQISSSSSLRNLDPYLEHGMLRVGGRLQKSSLPHDNKHQIILPKCYESELMIREQHERLGHTGRLHVIAKLRERFWIVSVNSVARSVLSKCVKCRKIRGQALTQKMANLPEERLIPDKPPFSCVGVDFFGTFLVRQGRSKLKRYGVLFTCFTTRAVHIEVAYSLETSSFIQSLRRFIARRGQVAELWSDNGTNFVGAQRELTQAIDDWNQAQINDFLLQRNIKWKFNVPRASHHGGIWERLIRSTRKILTGICNEQILTDESLLTLLCEVEGIINSRPLTTLTDDPRDLNVLTANHLLLLKEQVSLPPGNFSEKDNFARRRWRQVQYLADIFWKRWTREYLPLLQKRSKWVNTSRNVTNGDIVLIMDSSPRSSWVMGRVIETFPDKQGLIRSAKIQTQFSVCVRPISKMCALLECDSV